MSNTFDYNNQYDVPEPRQYNTNTDLYGTQNPSSRPEQQDKNEPERQRETTVDPFAAPEQRQESDHERDEVDEVYREDEVAEEGMNPYDTENQFTQGGQGTFGSTQEDYGNQGGWTRPDSDRDRYGTHGSQDQYGYQQ